MSAVHTTGIRRHLLKVTSSSEGYRSEMEITSGWSGIFSGMLARLVKAATGSDCVAGS
jgi:hypothetical protein